MKKILLICFLLQPFLSYLQEEKREKEEFEMEHKLSFSSGITFVPRAINEAGDKEVIFVPTLGLDYTFEFHRFVAVGLVNEFELSKYFVERDSTNEIEREYAYTGLLVLHIIPFHNFSINLGGGGEFDKHKILPCISAGIEYELNFGKNWFGKAAIQYNYLFKYQSVGFQVGFGYAFKSHK
ncbi:MAG: hypothetical protein R2799_05220 [Crocinitomicaceae bacterium]